MTPTDFSNDSSEPRMERRVAIKWMLTALATVPVAQQLSFGAEQTAATPSGKGYGSDPDLTKIYKPGDVWPLTFTPQQRATASALCDAIIPSDAQGPGAAALKVQDFIDEWVSAPYPGHSDDRKIVLDGLAWIDAEAQKRFGNSFANLVGRQRNAICDDICSAGKAKEEFRSAARFFGRFRDLTAGGYYSTPEGMKDIGYVGNVALERYDGPTPEVLKKLGLA